MYNFAVITGRACNVYNWKNEIVFVTFSAVDTQWAYNKLWYQTKEYGWY